MSVLKIGSNYRRQQMDEHKFQLRDGKWWCLDEDVISEECSDDNRCNNDCVCNNTEYDVSVSCIFEAEDFEDAVGQMATWLSENAYRVGYRVEWTDKNDVFHSEFVDAEKIDWSVVHG
jgi:hypothetical protein